MTLNLRISGDALRLLSLAMAGSDVNLWWKPSGFASWRDFFWFMFRKSLTEMILVSEIIALFYRLPMLSMLLEF